MSTELDEIRAVMADADCLATPAMVDAAISAMAAAITAELATSNPLVYTVMTGGLVVAGRLIARLDFPLEVAYVHASRYGHQLAGNSLLDWRVRPTHELGGRCVLIIDDILDEGHTLRAICKHMQDEGAARVMTAVLVHKDHTRKAVPGMRADFTGLDIPDRFLFGCGMDYKGYWRNAPGIYALKGH